MNAERKHTHDSVLSPQVNNQSEIPTCYTRDPTLELAISQSKLNSAVADGHSHSMEPLYSYNAELLSYTLQFADIETYLCM